MSWATKVGWLGIWVSQRTDGFGAVVSRNTRRATLQFVNSHRERSTQHRRVFLHLMLQFQFTSTGNGDRRTKHTPTLTQHEVHLLWRNHFSGSDEIAFVLAVLIIYHNDELALLEVFKRCFYRCKLNFIHSYNLII